MNGRTDNAAMDRIRAQIEARMAQLEREITAKLADASSLARYLGSAEDSDDLAFSDEVAEVEHAEVRRDADELRRARRALVRMDAGQYGECESCGEPIPAARLQALPMAVTCVKCQSQRESLR